MEQVTTKSTGLYQQARFYLSVGSNCLGPQYVIPSDLHSETPLACYGLLWQEGFGWLSRLQQLCATWRLLLSTTSKPSRPR
eukprot:1317823-Amphidinium_carterae.1